MNQFIKFLEALGNKQYSLPKDPEKQIFDFYTINMIEPNTDDNILNYDINETKTILVNQLSEKLLKDVFFSISKEMQHIYDAMYKPERFFNDKLFAEIYDKLENGLMPDYWNQRENFVKLSEKVFGEGYWSMGYGGKAWADISKAWLKLYYAKSIKEKNIWIDHIYDLEHNSGTVFDKLSSYFKSGYSWIVHALDFKRNVKNIKDMIPHCSPIVKTLARRVSYKEKEPDIEIDINNKKSKVAITDLYFQNLFDKKFPWASNLFSINHQIFYPENFIKPNKFFIIDFLMDNKILVPNNLDDKVAEWTKNYFEKNLLNPKTKFVRNDYTRQINIDCDNCQEDDLFGNINKKDYLQYIKDNIKKVK